jgi:glycosyltransferase involved in cell wall biosynthesis
MPTKPLVSIVIPSYNQGHYIAATLESILNQDYDLLECIVIDAGSTDGTVDILRKYSDRIRWISEPDRGESDGINKGIRLCRGEIYGRVNADDLLVDGCIATIAECFQQDDTIDLVYGECGIIDQNGKTWPAGRSLKTIKNFTTKKLLRKWYGILPQPTVFLKRSILERVGYQNVDLHHSADYDLWVRIAQAGYKIKYIPKELARFRVHSAQKSALVRRHHREIMLVTRKYGSYLDVIYAFSNIKWISMKTRCGRVKRFLKK